MSVLGIPGLDVGEDNTLTALLEVLDRKRSRNAVRAAYYDGRNAIQDLGISTPPAFRNLAIVLGWPAKSVDILNRRCRLEGFAIPGRDVADFGIDQVWADNRLGIEAPQSGASALVHSVSWLITTRGDVASGEPEALVTSRDALHGAGIWDWRRRRVAAFLSVLDVTDGSPSSVAMYLPGRTITAVKGASGRWAVDRRNTGVDRVMVEALVYRPRLGRPFGSSRISRAVMSLTDSALRTVIRSEVSAEFYSSPQRYLLGADESAFVDPTTGTMKSSWQAILGRIWAIDKDEDGQLPQVGQFPQSTQQPHMDQLKAWAQLFAGETDIPVSSLGISTDANPASAEAYYASREDLISNAESTTDGWGPAWAQTMRNAVGLMDPSAVGELAALQPKWRNPVYSSRAAAADATQKLVTVFPWMAESDVAVELLGLDADLTKRLLADKRKAAARATLQAAMNRAPAAAVTPDQQAAQMMAPVNGNVPAGG